MNFVPPNAQQITKALGDITQLPKDMQAAITSKLDESFQPVPIPSGGDWLNVYEEKGQTMKSFEKDTEKAVPCGIRKAIFIQPVGSFDHPRAAPLDLINEFTRAFFAGCDVDLLQTVNFSKNMKSRKNRSTRQIQYLTDGFHNYLSQARLQRKSNRELVTVAVTMADIYPDEDWNFVYGEASPEDSTGVYSFARLDPLFPTPPEELRNVPMTEEHRVIMLRRCVSVLVHEIGHLFGLDHCIYYNCLMNGINHEEEMDRQPFYLCPVCLRKLYSTLQFDVRKRYEKLAEVCEKYGLKEECIWYQKRLDCIRNNEA